MRKQVPNGPEETSWFRGTRIAARQFLSQLSRNYPHHGVILKEELSKSPLLWARDSFPDLPFLASSVRRKTTKKARSFFQGKPLKSLGKKGKTLKKARNSLQEKKPMNPKTNRKGRSGLGGILEDNLREGNCESRIVSRQWGDNLAL